MANKIITPTGYKVLLGLGLGAFFLSMFGRDEREHAQIAATRGGGNTFGGGGGGCGCGG